MTTAVEEGKGSALRPGRSLSPEKTRYLLYRRLVGSQGRSGQMWKISPPPGFDPRTVQPVTSLYTDYATRPTNLYNHSHISIYKLTGRFNFSVMWVSDYKFSKGFCAVVFRAQTCKTLQVPRNSDATSTATWRHSPQNGNLQRHLFFGSTNLA